MGWNSPWAAPFWWPYTPPSMAGRARSLVHAEHAFRDTRYPARLLGVARPRDELDRRIVARTAAWLEAGWIDVHQVLARRGSSAVRAVVS